MFLQSVWLPFFPPPAVFSGFVNYRHLKCLDSEKVLQLSYVNFISPGDRKMVKFGQQRVKCLQQVFPPRSLCLIFGHRELAAQGPAVVLPGQGHVEGLLVDDACGLELLELGGD